MTQWRFMVKSKIQKNVKPSKLACLSGARVSVLLTDEKRQGDPYRLLKKMPKGGLVILRHYDCLKREEIAKKLAKLCRQRGLIFLVSGDARLANKLRCGVHFREHDASRKALRGNRVMTAAAHSPRAISRAQRKGPDFLLVSPVFETASHPDGKSLGVHRFSRLIQPVKLPVIALGGITNRSAKKLKGIKIAGVAAIDGWEKL